MSSSDLSSKVGGPRRRSLDTNRKRNHSQQRRKRDKVVNVQVVVRCRPRSHVEKRSNAQDAILCLRKDVKAKTTHQGKHLTKTYTFDTVFAPGATQEDVYDEAVEPIIEEVLEGFNCTVFAYGQTGTGKTYTMEGDPSSNEHKGMIPRAIDQIFKKLEVKSKEFTVKVSFLEIYNEELIDLCADVHAKKPLRIFEDSTGKKGMLVNNLEEVMVQDSKMVLDVLHKALANRQVAETKLNKESSRSHCVFTITLHTKEASPDGEDVIRTGKLHLVDLAGSECIGRSGAKSKRAKEAGKINQSLLTLGRVINALVEQHSYVPYRDSKLTRLLQESLGGKSKTLIIATISPSQLCVDETISTLDYAFKAKNIKNKPIVNQRMSQKVYIRELTTEIAELKKELEYSRLKNGIHLPPDKYRHMVSESKQMREKIADFEMTLHAKVSERKEMVDKLKLSKEALDQAKTDLHAAESRLDEHRYITNVVRTHELELAEGARNLDSMLRRLNADKNKVHDKEQRLLALERENMAAAGRMATGVAQNVSRLSTSASEFTAKRQREGIEAERAVKASDESLTKEIDGLRRLLEAKQEEENEGGGEERTGGNEGGLQDLLQLSARATKEADAHARNIEAVLEDGMKSSRELKSTATNVLDELDRADSAFVNDMATAVDGLQKARNACNERVRSYIQKSEHVVEDQQRLAQEKLSGVFSESKRREGVVEGHVGSVAGALMTSLADVGRVINTLSQSTDCALSDNQRRVAGALAAFRDEANTSSSTLKRGIDARNDEHAAKMQADAKTHMSSRNALKSRREEEMSKLAMEQANVAAEELRARLVRMDEALSTKERNLHRMLDANATALKKQQDEQHTAVLSRVEAQNKALLSKIEALLEENVAAVRSELKTHASQQALTLNAQRVKLDHELKAIQSERNALASALRDDMQSMHSKHMSAAARLSGELFVNEEKAEELFVTGVVDASSALGTKEKAEVAKFVSDGENSLTKLSDACSASSSSCQSATAAARESAKREVANLAKKAEEAATVSVQKLKDNSNAHLGSMKTALDSIHDDVLEAGIRGPLSKLRETLLHSASSEHLGVIDKRLSTMSRTLTSTQETRSKALASLGSSISSGSMALSSVFAKISKTGEELAKSHKALGEAGEAESKKLLSRIADASKALSAHANAISSIAIKALDAATVDVREHADENRAGLEAIAQLASKYSAGFAVYQRTMQTPEKKEAVMQETEEEGEDSKLFSTSDTNEKLIEFFACQSPTSQKRLLETPAKLRAAAAASSIGDEDADDGKSDGGDDDSSNRDEGAPRQQLEYDDDEKEDKEQENDENVAGGENIHFSGRREGEKTRSCMNGAAAAAAAQAYGSSSSDYGTSQKRHANRGNKLKKTSLLRKPTAVPLGDTTNVE